MHPWDDPWSLNICRSSIHQSKTVISQMLKCFSMSLPLWRLLVLCSFCWGPADPEAWTKTSWEPMGMQDKSIAKLEKHRGNSPQWDESANAHTHIYIYIYIYIISIYICILYIATYIICIYIYIMMSKKRFGELTWIGSFIDMLPFVAINGRQAAYDHRCECPGWWLELWTGPFFLAYLDWRFPVTHFFFSDEVNSRSRKLIVKSI